MNELQEARFIHSAVNWSLGGSAIHLTLILVGERANPNVASPCQLRGKVCVYE